MSASAFWTGDPRGGPAFRYPPAPPARSAVPAAVRASDDEHDLREILKRGLAIPRSLAAADRLGANPHETYKQIAYESKTPQCDTHFAKSRPCPSNIWGVSDVYAVLDSAAADLSGSNPAKGIYRFNFNVTMSGSSHAIGFLRVLETVTEIEMGRTCMGTPVPLDIDATAPGLTLVADPGPVDPRLSTDPVAGLLSPLGSCGRITVLLAEVSSQCFLDYKGRQHHFECEGELVGTAGQPATRMELTPVDSRFIFTQPIDSIHGLTLQFFSPDWPVAFNPDVIPNIVLTVDGLGNVIVNVPSSLPCGNPIDLTTFLVPGDHVHLDGVNITTPGAPAALSSYLTRPAGLFVGATVTALTFGLDPAVGTGLGATTLASSTPITLRIEKNRLRMPLRFRTVIPELTNYISP